MAQEENRLRRNNYCHIRHCDPPVGGEAILIYNKVFFVATGLLRHPYAPSLLFLAMTWEESLIV